MSPTLLLKASDRPGHTTYLVSTEKTKFSLLVINIFAQEKVQKKTIVILSVTVKETETNSLWTMHGHFLAGVVKISSL